MELIFNVNNQVLTRADEQLVVANSQNYVSAQFNFSDDWIGKTITVYFMRNDKQYSVLLDDTKECLIPNEVLKKTGGFRVGVSGVADNTTITTNYVSVEIHTGNNEVVADQSEHQSLYEQILNKITEMKLGQIDEKTVQMVIDKYLEENPIGIELEDFELAQLVDDYIARHIDEFRGADGVGIDQAYFDNEHLNLKLSDGRKVTSQSLRGLPGLPGSDGIDGIDGLSAFEIAKKHGFEGTEQEWLESLKGKDGKDAKNGLDGNDGLSAFEIAKNHGFEGTEQEWVASLKGKDGKDADVTTSIIRVDELPKEGEIKDAIYEYTEAKKEKHTFPETPFPMSQMLSILFNDTSAVGEELLLEDYPIPEQRPIVNGYPIIKKALVPHMNTDQVPIHNILFDDPPTVIENVVIQEILVQEPQQTQRKSDSVSVFIVPFTIGYRLLKNDEPFGEILYTDWHTEDLDENMMPIEIKTSESEDDDSPKKPVSPPLDPKSGKILLPKPKYQNSCTILMVGQINFFTCHHTYVGNSKTQELQEIVLPQRKLQDDDSLLGSDKEPKLAIVGGYIPSETIVAIDKELTVSKILDFYGRDKEIGNYPRFRDVGEQTLLYIDLLHKDDEDPVLYFKFDGSDVRLAYIHRFPADWDGSVSYLKADHRPQQEQLPCISIGYYDENSETHACFIPDDIDYVFGDSAWYGTDSVSYDYDLILQTPEGDFSLRYPDIYIPTPVVQRGWGSQSTFQGQNRPENAQGKNAHAEGCATHANGEDSHAEGIGTTASGNYSHAEGANTTASKDYSHAEGANTTASGNASHAEGTQTTASGNYSHAEGNCPVASGESSHAEGESASAIGYTSHAEGFNTTANGDSSHTEGHATTTSGLASHAEGIKGIASGIGAHVEGGVLTGSPKNLGLYEFDYSSMSPKLVKTNDTNFTKDGYCIPPITVTPEGNESPSEKSWLELESEGVYVYSVDNTVDSSKTYYKISIVLGDNYSQEANGYFTHAEGSGTTSSGYASHAEGVAATASGEFSHTEGNSTTASGTASHAEGVGATASGEFSHTEGNSTTASGTASHAEGNSTIASGHNSHAEGYLAEANGDGSHAEGKATIASGMDSHAEGDNTSAIGDASHVEGRSVNAIGNCSHAEGFGTAADGNNSHAEGGSTTASGMDAHAEGHETTASGLASHAQNVNTIAQGWSQTAIGRYNIAQGTENKMSSTDYALIIGNGSTPNTRSNALAIQWDGTIVFADGTQITPKEFAKLKAFIQTLPEIETPQPA